LHYTGSEVTVCGCRFPALATGSVQARHLHPRVAAPSLPYGADILSNLVVNALEASPPCATVNLRLVRAECTLGQVALSVEDQGPGIPPELSDKIFQPFFTTRPVGTGLGLAIVSRRAEEIGGAVEYLSPVGQQGGTRFVVRFGAAA